MFKVKYIEPQSFYEEQTGFRFGKDVYDTKIVNGDTLFLMYEHLKWIWTNSEEFRPIE